MSNKGRALSAIFTTYAHTMLQGLSPHVLRLCAMLSILKEERLVLLKACENSHEIERGKSLILAWKRAIVKLTLFTCC
jgi:hypothetical protein